MKQGNRKHPRHVTAFPIRFNLNPDYHHVPAIRKLGVGGTARSVSSKGLLIDSWMDLLDLCQIFAEAIEDGSPFELEVVLTGSRQKRLLIRASVSWYQLSESKNGIRYFRAGLQLKDDESLPAARSIIKSITGITLT